MRSIPTCETFGWSLMRPKAYTPTDAANNVSNWARTAPTLKKSLAKSPFTRDSFTLSSAGCTANANPPENPAQNRFSFDGRCLKSLTRSLASALIPVCRGVGGGPAGCVITCSKVNGSPGSAVPGGSSARTDVVKGHVRSTDPQTTNLPEDGDIMKGNSMVLRVLKIRSQSGTIIVQPRR